jgi:hypothetical protein
MELDELVFNLNPIWGGLFYSKDINESLDPRWFNLTHPIPRQEIPSSLQDDDIC